jgi:hypothetical protein
VVRIHHQGQVTAARNAANLLGKLGQRQDHQIRRAEHRSRADRAGKHPDLKPQRGGHAGRHGIEHRSRMHAGIALQHLAIALTAFRE